MVFFPGTGYSSNTEFSYEDRVIKHLLRKYAERGKYGRPVKNYSDILNLHFGLQLVQIMNLDERKQILTLNVWTNYVSEIYTTLPKILKCVFCVALSLTYFGCNFSWNIVEFSIWDFQTVKFYSINWFNLTFASGVKFVPFWSCHVCAKRTLSGK